MQRTGSFEKTLMVGKIEGRRRMGWQRMRWLNGMTYSMNIIFEKAPGVGDGQGGLACCGSWGRKELDTTGWLNWIELTLRTFVSKVMSLSFNMLSMLVIAFLPRSKHLLVSCLQSPSAVTLEPKKIVSDSTVSPSICHEVIGPNAMILVFWMLSFKTAFHSPLSLLSRGSLAPLYFLP